MNPQYPILEYDPAPGAIFSPHPLKTTRPIPQRAVLCFFQEVITALREEGRLVEIGQMKSEIGSHPIYVLDEGPQEVVVMHPLVGAPLSGGLLDELIATGVNRFIACGGCGVLRPEIAAGHPVILTAAVRDEGTSYHYLPPSREVLAQPAPVAVLEESCRAAGIEYRLGKTWTTDGLFRETAARRLLRVEEGCDVVEMEAAAFFAIAQFRGVQFGQIVYGGDLVVPEGWDHRDWYNRFDDRRLMFRLALDACLRL